MQEQLKRFRLFLEDRRRNHKTLTSNVAYTLVINEFDRIFPQSLLNTKEDSDFIKILQDGNAALLSDLRAANDEIGQLKLDNNSLKECNEELQKLNKLLIDEREGKIKSNSL